MLNFFTNSGLFNPILLRYNRSEINLKGQEMEVIDQKKSPTNTTAPTIKLDLACGQTPREGFEGVDAYAPNPKHKVDLLQFPWPWQDSSVDEIFCSHFIEHIPMEERAGKDLFFCFFDECYRILKPNGIMTVICPSARSNRAFMDPTHRRFIVGESFLYLSDSWRKKNKLDHYHVNCNFHAQVSPITVEELRKEDPQTQNRLIMHYWNVVLDWQASLKAIK